VRWLDNEEPDDEPAEPAETGTAPLALRRAIDRALTAPVACPDCGRTMACPCEASRSEGRVDAIISAVSRWLP
ncbi:hypothetical protein ACPXCX_54265, partial [Streptomyces sp. DT225]